MVGIQDSTTNHFGSLIRSGGKYIIPKYQRDYSWDVEQWDDLWQDIESMLSESSDHYMGYLVLQTVNGKDCRIIDGQQRFTTITIIILAAIKSIQKLVDNGIEVEDNEKRIRTLKETYIGNNDPVTLEYDNILVLNRNNNSYYKDYIVKLGELKLRNTSYTEKLMKKCFEWFEKQLANRYQSGREYAEFITKIVEHLYFTIIRVNNEMNAFKVFETLNARGVQLSSADLLKNYLFSLVDNSEDYPDRIDTLEEKWSSLTKNIQAEKLPDFIRYYWNSKNKTVRSSDLFKAIRDNIHSDKEVFALINEMLQYSDVYMALRSSSDVLWQNERSVVENIELLNLFNMKQPYSVLMAGYKCLDFASFGKLLNDVIIIGFRYSVICGKNPNDIERVYNSLANEISNKKEYERSLLKGIYVDDAEFVTSFGNKQLTENARNNKVIKYILGKIDRFNGGLRDISLDSETETIEHILPQHPKDGWDFDPSELDSYIYRLGNLCLLEKKYNRDIENNPYSEKVDVYRQSSFITTSNIPDRYSEWNIKSIISRQTSMANCAKGIWHIDF